MHRKVGAVTFDKRVVLFIHVEEENERAQIGEGVRWFTLVSGADFRRDDRLFYWLLLRSILFFSRSRRHD